MMDRVVVKNISKKFRIGFKENQTAFGRFCSFFSGREPRKTIKALNEVSFRAKAGEILGIIGRNGSGKSTLLRIIAGIYKQDEGEVYVNGRILPLIGLGEGLKERLTMKGNICLVSSLFGLSQKQVKENFNLIVEFAGLEDFVNTKLYQFSSGMLQRLVFSISVYCNPDLLLLDEVFAVGDEEFKKKSANKIKELVKNGATAVLVSHYMWMIEEYCDRVVWMDNGMILKEGNAKQIVKEYLKG